MTERINMLDEMANFTFTTKYAKYDEKKKRRETWDETVGRVEKMHLKKYAFLDEADKAEIVKACDFVRERKVTPSMRSMQFGGKAVEAHNTRLFNCGTRHIDSIRSFSESFYALLCGTGVGFGLTERYLKRLPNLVSAENKTGIVITYVVQDSIEGWADSIEALMNCYFKNTAYTGRKIVFDYSKIRAKGEKLKTGGGKAPGYKGLKNCHKKIKELLDVIIENNRQSVLKTINAYDILMYCADAVLSGGIRRSACSVIFDASDLDMMNAKTGDWFKNNPQRARSNNSAIIIRGKTSFEEFKQLIEKTKEFGEPGFLYVENEDQLLNPCVTGDTLVHTDKGHIFINELVLRFEGGEKFKAYSYNIPGQKIELNDITMAAKTRTDVEVLVVETNDGTCLKLTSDHEVFVKNVGYIEAQYLNVGDVLIRSMDGITFSKTCVTKVYSGMHREDVYDITVENNHNFFGNGLLIKNCFEISFIPVTADGQCGFQFCNLTSINGSKVKTQKDFDEASWAATVIGTLQAGYTDFPYLSHASEILTKEEALLGVSITGMMDNPDILFNPEYQRQAASVAVKTNELWAKKLNIRPAARITCNKPEGTNSIVLSAASGIHPHHARKYFRRIQCNKIDNVYKFFKLYNEHACEESVWSENKTDDVITFPIEVPDSVMIKADLTAIEHLELIKLTQQNWVESGTTKYNKKPLHHSVSCTVIVKDDEWNSVEKYLFDNQNFFTAVSLLPFTGDKIYKQAPMEAVVTPEDHVKFNKLVTEWSKMNYKKLEEVDDETCHTTEAACSGGGCEVTKL